MKDKSKEIGVIIIAAILPFLLQGNMIIPDSILDLHINPGKMYEGLLYQWNSSIYSGYNTGWSVVYIPIAKIFSLLAQLGLPNFIWSRIWFCIVLGVSGLSIYYLLGVSKLRNKVTCIISPIAYMYSLYVLTQIQGASTMLLPYAALPLMLGLYIKGLYSKNYFRYSILLALSTQIMTGVNPPLVSINVLVLLVYLMYEILILRRVEISKLIKYNAIALGLCLLINLWWIVPFIYQMKTTWLGGILSEPPTMHNMKTSYLEVFRELGLWSFYSGEGNKDYYNYSSYYRFNPLLLITTFLIPVVSFALLLKRNITNNYVKFFMLLVILSIPMVSGIYPSPTASLYEWLYNNMPLFKMFRGSYKFVIPISLSYSILFGYAISILSESMRKDTNSKVVTAFLQKAYILGVAIVIINFWPGFTNRLFEKETMFKEIPHYWYQASAYINSDKEDAKVLVLPDQYFSLYNWGNTMGEISAVLLDKPILVKAPGHYPLPNTEKVVYSMYENLRENKKLGLDNIYKILNIKYFIQRNDFNWKSANSASPVEVKKWLEKQDSVKYVKTFGSLDIYRINQQDIYPHIYTESSAILLYNYGQSEIDNNIYSNLINENKAIVTNDASLLESSNKLKSNMEEAWIFNSGN